MRLLFDQNLSPRLVAALADLYPGSTHVREVNLAYAYDDAVWRYAAEHDLTIVSKDADFHERSFILGAPPKVIWIRLALLRDQHEAIARFEAEAEAAFLALG